MNGAKCDLAGEARMTIVCIEEYTVDARKRQESWSKEVRGQKGGAVRQEARGPKNKAWGWDLGAGTNHLLILSNLIEKT
jgi:hypothetical protein